MKILGIILLIIIVLFILLFIKLKIESNKPMVEDNYWDRVQTSEEIETKYMSLGNYTVKSIKYDVTEERWTNYTIWYPEEMENSNKTYPLIVMANGTGVQNFKYKPVFKHLASWGFIVIGNDDLSSGLGDSTSKSLDYILELNKDENNIFYNKINIDNIGVAGHSQGGVATIHAIYNFDNSNLYKSAYTASATTESMISSWKLEVFEYDIERISIPILMVAGTGKTDSETISPLADMQYNLSKSNAPTIIARRNNADHGEMLYVANGYMIAWFRYTLMNDTEASKAFIGENAEIYHNVNWQDFQSKNL